MYLQNFYSKWDAHYNITPHIHTHKLITPKKKTYAQTNHTQKKKEAHAQTNRTQTNVPKKKHTHKQTKKKKGTRANKPRTNKCKKKEKKKKHTLTLKSVHTWQWWQSRHLFPKHRSTTMCSMKHSARPRGCRKYSPKHSCAPLTRHPWQVSSQPSGSCSCSSSCRCTRAAVRLPATPAGAAAVCASQERTRSSTRTQVARREPMDMRTRCFLYYLCGLSLLSFFLCTVRSN